MRFVSFIILSVLVFSGCGNGESDMSQDSQRYHQKLLIPLYSYPFVDDTWGSVVSLKQNNPLLEITVIVNQSNGNFTQQDSNYAEAIKLLSENKVRVVGYVYTSYGERDIAQVQENIDHWKIFYQEYGLEGIFFDEVSNRSEDLEYYKNCSNYAKNSELGRVVLNPGAKVPQEYIDAEIADIIVTRETTYENATAASDFNTPSNGTQLGLLLYESAGVDMARLSCSYAKEHAFGYLYATDDGFDGNPWDSLSSYLDATASMALEGCD